MILADASRAIFQFLSKDKIYIELGVYKGDYALGIKENGPEFMYLVDPWAMSDLESLLPSGYGENDVRVLQEAFKEYYPFGVDASLKEAYKIVQEKFGSDSRVKIIRKKSNDALSEFEPFTADFIYVDGNHRYDYVLRDLELWSSVLKDDGVLVLNDCYVAPLAKLQHLSVLEAVSTFIKLSNFVPVCLVNERWADLVLCRRPYAEMYKQKIQDQLHLKGVNYIELPDTLIHSAHYKEAPDSHFISREYLTFC